MPNLQTFTLGMISILFSQRVGYPSFIQQDSDSCAPGCWRQDSPVRLAADSPCAGTKASQGCTWMLEL